MVELGRGRSRALGWPDAYAFTKSLGENALLDSRGELPVTFVRPSIVESSLAQPRPGWIRGFRMAEPVIISYARGLLKQFPGVPEGIVDVIPVDLVVAALIAVAAKGPDDSGPTVYQVASGARNPLQYGRLVDLVENWFTERPLYDHRGQPIVVPKWSFPGRGRVQGQLRRATQVLGAAERVVNALPLRGERAAGAARIEERRSEAERALDYVELYGAYSETEARFRIDRTVRLFESLDPSDRAAFCFDPAVIDWTHYIEDVHLPSIVEHARVRTSPTSKRSMGTRRRALAESHPVRRAALCRLRPREHPHRLERRRELCLAGDAPPRARRSRPPRGGLAGGGAKAAQARPPRPERLPARLLSSLRGGSGGPAPFRQL